MKALNTFLVTVLACTGMHANTDKVKQTLQANYMVNYKSLPSEVETASDIFSEGMFYGRLRTNWFFFQYEDENAAQENHNILGVGGSLMYKTAPYAGLSATAGLNYTSAGTSLDNHPSDVAFIRAGKDTISRFNAVNGKGSSFAVLSQAYLQYEHEKFKVRAGREIFNSFFTKSNDSKMIPNTFEGITLESKDIERTRIRAAYLTGQKLRDHDNFHSVIMYDDRSDAVSGVVNAKWNENDDSAIHKGLNHTNFQKVGQDKNPALVIVDGYTRALLDEKLKISGSALYLKDLFTTAMLELNYKFDVGNGYTLTPGVRYVEQFDDGAGAIGGAALNGSAATDANGGSTAGRGEYKDANSVDTYMTAARLVLNKGAGSLALGYTDIADEADFITPWRGFVTAGYTRAMARYNWIANTQTYRLRGTYDFGKADVVKGLRTYLSFTRENYDEEKNIGLDANIYYFGLIQELQEIPNLSLRFRTEYVERVAASTDDHAEVRMELNYLF